MYSHVDRTSISVPSDALQGELDSGPYLKPTSTSPQSEGGDRVKINVYIILAYRQHVHCMYQLAHFSIKVQRVTCLGIHVPDFVLIQCMIVKWEKSVNLVAFAHAHNH